MSDATQTSPDTPLSAIVPYEVDAETGCWNYGGYVQPQGYGIVSIGGKQYKAHRIMLARRLGELPAGCHVHHLCENKRCCNPDHLEAKSPSLHLTDHVRVRKSTLTVEQVAEIKRRAYEGEQIVDMAREYGQLADTLHKIVDGYQWTDVPGPVRVWKETGCVECGRSLAGYKRGTRFCGNACRQRDWKKRKPEAAQAAQDRYKARLRAERKAA